MKRQRKTVHCLWGSPEFRRVMTLSVLCALGILSGYFAAGRMSLQAVEQLQAYLTAYARLQTSTGNGATLLRAFAVYFRCCLCILLFSFASAGRYLIPLVFLFQGFRLAFAVTSFSCCLTASPLAIFSLFFLRAVIVLPATLYFGSAAMQSAVARESHFSSGFWRRFGICFGALLLGVILETTVVPHLFSSVFQL